MQKLALMSNEANSGFTLYITHVKYYLSYPDLTTKISVLEPILFTCFEGMKTTSPYRQNITQPIPYSLQEGTIVSYNNSMLLAIL